MRFTVIRFNKYINIERIRMAATLVSTCRCMQNMFAELSVYIMNC